ncbi:hypothetical protein FKP32DRAFT_105645 [Trametes sanguinea]|nr:hypothetical protein FKP32DRAFT_105645 [Trametes sanguinea]
MLLFATTPATHCRGPWLESCDTTQIRPHPLRSIMASTRLCYSTQNIPAPMGPRRPSCTRNRTAPLPIGTRKPGTIPADRIEDVLRDPGYYCEVYPDTLPLTRRLYRQIWGRSASVFTAEPLIHAQADARGLYTRSGVHEYERLQTEGDDVVFYDGGDQDGTSPGRKRLLPIGSEVRAPNCSMDNMASSCIGEHLRECGLDTPANGESSSQVRRSRREMRSEVAMTMDILERGEWSTTGISARVQLYGVEVLDSAISGSLNVSWTASCGGSDAGMALS